MISDHADPLARIGSAHCGGQNVFVYHLARLLAARGHQVDVYTRWDSASKREVVYKGDNLRIIRVQAGPKQSIPRDAFLTILSTFTANILRRIKHEQLDYDVIHTNYWFSGLAGIDIAKTLSIPHLHVYHSLGHIRYSVVASESPQLTNLAILRQQAERDIAHMSTGIISTSPVEKDTIVSLFSIPRHKVTVIPIGIDPTIFAPSAQSIEVTGSPLILYVGRLEWRKGVSTLLEATAILQSEYPGLQVAIVGGKSKNTKSNPDFIEQQRLELLTDSLSLRDHVHFLGAKPQMQLAAYYSVADVCVVPSYYEQFGIVPLESMACGTPVVASRTGGLTYTVEDGVTGYHATTRNAKDFAEKIDCVLKQGKAHFSPACLERIEQHFEWAQIADYYDYYLTKQVTKKRSIIHENSYRLAF